MQLLRSIALFALAGAASASSFSGTGQIRAVASSSEGNGTDLGCLTNSGAWTVHDEVCGNFTGTRASSSVYVTLTSLDGPCTLSNSNFTCGSDLTALKFWVRYPAFQRIKVHMNANSQTGLVRLAR